MCCSLPIFCSLVPVSSELLLGLPEAKPIESQVKSQFLDLYGISAELVTPTAIELSGCNGKGGCFHPISCKVFLSGTISFAIKNSAVIPASATDNTTYFMIYAMVSSGPFHLGMASFSNRNMCAPDLLFDLDSLLKLVSEWAASIMLLAL